MRNIDDQMTEILRRADIIKVKKDYQKMKIGFAVSIAACVMLLVVGLCSARYFKVFTLASVIGSLSLSVTFHGLYNLLVSKPGLSSYLGYFLPLVTAGLLYVPYRKLTANFKTE